MTLFHLGKTSELALHSTSTTFYIIYVIYFFILLLYLCFVKFLLLYIVCFSCCKGTNFLQYGKIRFSHPMTMTAGGQMSCAK